jgi:cytidine deaminase
VQITAMMRGAKPGCARRGKQMELTEHDRSHAELAQSCQAELLAGAREAMAAAYCPYSNFAVGAAVLTTDGSIYRGCNVENASYGLSICAERNAIFAAVADGKLDFVAIAVVTNAKNPARPCGACRQVIAEFSQAGNPVMILSASATGEVVSESITNLLPETFTLL